MNHQEGISTRRPAGYLGAALAFVASLAGCHDPTDATAENFKTALDQQLAKEGPVCIEIRLPMDLPKDRPSRHDAAEAAALLEAGLVVAEEFDGMRRPGLGMRVNQGPEKMIRYSVAPTATSYMVDSPETFTKAKGQDLCFAKIAVDRIGKWEGPVARGPGQMAKVRYTYKLVERAPWSTNEKLIAAFPKLKQWVEGEGRQEKRRDLRLTNEGWEAQRNFFGR